MTCPDTVTLSAYSDGELEGAQTRAVKAHIAECATCRNLLDEMKAADNAVAEMFASVALPPARGMLSRAERRRRRLLSPVPFLAAAALLIALSGALWLLHGIHPVTKATQPATPQPNATTTNVATAQTTIPDWLEPRFRHETYEQFVRGALAPEIGDVEKGRSLEKDYGQALLQTANSIPLNGRS